MALIAVFSIYVGVEAINRLISTADLEPNNYESAIMLQDAIFYNILKLILSAGIIVLTITIIYDIVRGDKRVEAERKKIEEEANNLNARIKRMIDKLEEDVDTVESIRDVEENKYSLSIAIKRAADSAPQRENFPDYYAYNKAMNEHIADQPFEVAKFSDLIIFLSKAPRLESFGERGDIIAAKAWEKAYNAYIEGEGVKQEWKDYIFKAKVAKMNNSSVN